MQLKTYRAKTIADALAQVKKDLGRDAVILHTRMVKVGGWLGVGGRRIVEITAGHGVNVRGPVVKAAAQPSRATAGVLAPATPSGSALLDRASKSTDSYVRSAPAAAAPSSAPAPVAPAGAPLAASALFQPASAGAALALEQDLAAIKSMVSRVLSGSSRSRCALLPEALHAMYLRLLEAEVAADLADEVIAGVRDDLGTGIDNPSEVRAAVVRRLASLAPVSDGALPPPAADGRPRTIALIGPTGVGKTTTVAKLAATYKLRQGRKVGLVTADTYRIAAVEQLRTYANIIGLPLRVAATPAEMSSACAALSDCDCVLIDTAGRSPHDTERLDELRAFLAAARPHETHLVLSSTSSEACLLGAAGKFASAKPDRVIFTKLDEAVNFGVLINVARRVDAKVSWLTTGQEVPDAIEASRPERIARLILDGAVRA